MQPDEMSGWGNGNGLAGFVGGGGGRGEFDTLSVRPASSTGFSHFFSARLFRETSYFL